MGSSRAKILLVLALIFALATGWLVYSYLQQQQARMSRLAAKDRVAAVQVVVAGRALSMGHRLTAEDMAAIAWPRESVPEGALHKMEAALGKYLRREVVKGEPILTDLLTAEVAAAGGLTNLIEPGRRAVTIEVDPVTGVGGFMRPGSQVDVLATLNTSSSGKKTMSTKMILQDIRVVAVDQVANPLLQILEGEKPRTAKTVTLLVTPEEAERLTLAAKAGSIQLAMRNIKDDMFAFTGGATIDELLPSRVKKAAPAKKSKSKKKVRKPRSKPRPKPPPVVREPAVTEVEIFRGSEREVEEFEEEIEE